MSKPQKPVRQDYIAKVRYINHLPPPPLNAKFLKYNTTQGVTKHAENEALLSSLFRKENFNQYIAQADEEYGMSLNPLQNPLFSADGALLPAPSNVQLHPKDRALLRDAGVGKINKSEPGVSFLRRTEYIAERQAAARPEERALTGLQKEDQSDKADPDSQLRAVEQSFEDAQQSLGAFSGLRHPRKTKLRAVLAFPLLPDTASLDTTFLAVKFTGSASMARELQAQKAREKEHFDEALAADALACAVYKPITSEDGEWVSFYQMKDRQALKELRLRLDSTEKEQPSSLLDDEDAAADAFRFRHHKNYDMLYHPFSKPYEELALRFVPEEGTDGALRKRRAAYYCPIAGRVELKKHRASANTEINRFLADNTMDVLDFTLREPTTDELRKMDNVRSEFDPMEYEGDDDDDDDDDDESEEPLVKEAEGDEA